MILHRPDEGIFLFSTAEHSLLTFSASHTVALILYVRYLTHTLQKGDLILSYSITLDGKMHYYKPNAINITKLHVPFFHPLFIVLVCCGAFLILLDY